VLKAENALPINVLGETKIRDSSRRQPSAKCAASVNLRPSW
jgi:hypothetical protein